MKYALLASGLAIAIACSGMAFAQSETTRTTTTTTTLSPEEQTTVREYVTQHNYPSARVEHFDVGVGAVVPPNVTFYEVPNMRYRYTIVNDRRVVVDPETRRIIEVEQ
jgi:hypothetical protein